MNQMYVSWHLGGAKWSIAQVGRNKSELGTGKMSENGQRSCRDSKVPYGSDRRLRYQVTDTGVAIDWVTCRSSLHAKVEMA